MNSKISPVWFCGTPGNCPSISFTVNTRISAGALISNLGEDVGRLSREGAQFWPKAGLCPLWRTRKNPFDVIYCLYKMKQSHWLLCLAENCDWSRQIAPLTNLTRESVLVEWKLTAKAELNSEIYKYYKGPLTDLLEPLLGKIYYHITSSFLVSPELFYVL